MAAPHPRPLGVPQPELPRLRPARLPRDPLQTILRWVLVKSEREDSDRARITVEDSGTGIEPQHIDKIFGSFFTTKVEGMGMGLSICRSIIESHDGRLWASAGRS